MIRRCDLSDLPANMCAHCLGHGNLDLVPAPAEPPRATGRVVWDGTMRTTEKPEPSRRIEDDPDLHGSPLVAAARALSAIEDAYTRLRERAIDHGAHRLMPGGPAMVALAGVASPDEWSEIIAAEELRHLSTCPKPSHAHCHYADHANDDDGQEPPLQTLLFWSEAWRTEHQWPMPARPTVATEAAFIRWALNWAWDHEPQWDDFAADMAACRTRLENLLHEGVRVAFTGVTCLYEECKGATLIRKTVPTRGKDGGKAWRLTDWHCPKCKRSWDDDAYARHVAAGVLRTKIADIDGETWVTVDRASLLTGRPEATIRSWVSRGQVATTTSADKTGRAFVRWDDVAARNRLFVTRRERALAVRAHDQAEAV